MPVGLPIAMKILDQFLIWLSLIVGGALLAFMMFLGTINVLVMRKIMNAPIQGAEDLLILSLVLLVAVAIPFGGRIGAHIEIEILEARMSEGFKRRSMIALRALAGALMLLMAYELMVAGGKATRFGETTQQLLISYEPFYYALSLCVAIYALVLASDILQLLSTGRVQEIALEDAL